MTDTQPTGPTPPGQGTHVDYQSMYGAPVDRDAEHLKILAICWYVASGLAVFAGCFPLIYVGLGISFIMNPNGFGGGGAGPAAETMGWMFAVGGGCASLVGWVAVILGFLTARSLSKRRRIMLCYVTAGLACLYIPFGTVLGIFTFLVLARPSVRARFT